MCGRDETIIPIHPILKLCGACKCKKSRVDNPKYNDKWYELAKKTRANLPLGLIEKAKKEAKEIAAMQGWDFTNITLQVKADRPYLFALPTDEERKYYPCGQVKLTGIHVLVLEHKLGRKLEKGEHAHHIDDDPLNNWPHNIELKKGPIHNSETHKKSFSNRVCHGPGPHRYTTNSMLLPLSNPSEKWYIVDEQTWCAGCYDRRLYNLRKQKKQRTKNK
jgi:hypothetical protein